MSCKDCGARIEGAMKFCHNCGRNVANNSLVSNEREKKINKEGNVDNSRMTAEEYLECIDIESKEEARKYLNRLGLVFWIMIINFILLGVSVDWGRALALKFYYIYTVMYIIFIGFCVNLMRIERLPRFNAMWCIFFAPLSWFPLYSVLANPLKIILGQVPPPFWPGSEGEKQAIAKANRKSWRRMKIIGGFALGVIVFLVICVIYWPNF